MTAGKARDDGYRGVHVGSLLRQAYEAARIRNGDEFREALKMCYLIAKKFNDTGCLALQTTHGQHLADFKEKR